MPGLEGVWPSPQSRKDKYILNLLRKFVHKTIILSKIFFKLYCLSLGGWVALVGSTISYYSSFWVQIYASFKNHKLAKECPLHSSSTKTIQKEFISDF
jgi:hypothetical protein